MERIAAYSLVFFRSLDKVFIKVVVSRLTVLHVDTDFDLIAAITGQPIERLER